MDTVDDLKRKLHQAEKENVELLTQRKQEKSQYEKEIIKLRLELERGEAIRRGLEYELSVARKEAQMQMYAAEEELCVAKSELVELQVLSGKNQQKVAEAEKSFYKAQQKWEEEHQKCAKEKDDIRRVYHHEILFLVKEKSEAERTTQDLNDALQNMRRKLRDVEAEHNGCSDMLRRQASELEFRADRHQRLMRELEAATERTRKLEGDTEAARAAHLECKYTKRIMQLRIQELEEALNSEKGSSAEGLSVLQNTKRDFRESANAHEREQNVLQREHFSSSKQLKEMTEERKENRGLSGKLDLTKSSSSMLLEEGKMEVHVLRSLYQHLVESSVLTKQPEVPIDSLSWSELCVLVYENIDTLVLDFRRAQDKISHLEHVCKDKTDTMRDLQRSQEDAFQNIAEQLKAQEHCWQKEKRHLELQYSSLLAEAHARAKEYQAAVQQNRERMYALEKNQEKLAHENISVRNTLTTVQRERSSLLAACALLSGSLCPLYSRLCAMTSQKDLLQDQVNFYEFLNQRIETIVHTFPAEEENSQDEARQRQRRAKALVYVFRRAVIVVLAANRLRAAARSSTSLFTWTNGLEGGNGIQVCVGESEGRRYRDGADCLEALGWLTSSNLHSAIISSLSELQDVLSKPDPNFWLSGNSLINAARSSFSKLMDKLCLMLGTVPLNYPRCITYLEKDSLIQRLACGLLRINNQALEAGLHERLPSVRNVTSLQQLVFEYTRRLHMAETKCRSLGLQLEEFKWSFSEMKKDAEKARSLQEQLNTLQHRMITQDSIHEELNNALQREHKARLLLLEQEQQLNELNNRLQMLSSETADKGQDLNLSIRSLPETAMDMRRRDRVLNHQKRLLTQMEQDRRRLQESVQNAERALLTAENDRELIITHMKAVETTLQMVREQALMPSAAAATTEFCLELPRLQIDALPDEELWGRPEAIAFQDVIRSFMDIYQLAASRVETLLRESPQLHTAAQRSRQQAFTFRESYESGKESKHPSSFKLDSQADQTHVPEFWLLPTEAEMSSSMTLQRASTQSPVHASSSVIPDRPSTGSSMSAGGILDRTRTRSPIHMSSSGILDRASTGPSIHVSPGEIPDRAGTESSTHMSADVIPDRSSIRSPIHMSSSGIPDRATTGPSIHMSDDAIPEKNRTRSPTHMSPGVISDRPGTELSIHVSPGATPDRSSIQPPIHLSSSGIPDRSSTRSPIHQSSSGIPDRSSTRSPIHMSSSETPDRSSTRSPIHLSSSGIPDRSSTRSPMHVSSSGIPDRSSTRSPIHMSADVILDRSSSLFPTQMSSSGIPDRSSTRSPIHLSSSGIPDRSSTQPPMHLSSSGIPDRSSTQPPIHLSSSGIPDTSSTRSPIHLSSSGTADRSSTQPPIHMSSSGIPGRPGTGSSIQVFSSVITDRPASAFTIHVSPGEVLDRIRTLSPIRMSSTVTPDRSHSPPLIRMSPRAKPKRIYSVPSIHMSSGAILDRDGTGSSLDISSHVLPERTGTGSSLDISSHVLPERAGTGSSLDISSGVRRSRTVIVSARNISSNVMPHRTGIGTGSSDISSGMLMDRTSSGPSVDAFFFVRPHQFGGGSSMDAYYSVTPNRSSSLPSIRSFSQDVLSSTRKTEGNQFSES
ncbi:coiled-coil domain-containing protein 171-like isoform X3 [Chiroxiphia lanceolata]|uniref:coiled-coil domain-containing protein 171-like isoform X3 n=1 Tax=Chiroxiphia lanceolata TaxID=296741 RepID=UPI0013CF0D34|nr:coiled-coil domain-containing protein 171-like isoform X3 [Chiroxiphia lanceolata]